MQAIGKGNIMALRTRVFNVSLLRNTIRDFHSSQLDEGQ